MFVWQDIEAHVERIFLLLMQDTLDKHDRDHQFLFEITTDFNHGMVWKTGIDI